VVEVAGQQCPMDKPSLEESSVLETQAARGPEFLEGLSKDSL
jgi:hypothetical protein